MIPSARIVVFLCFLLGTGGVCPGATVPTERVTAPRSIEPIPGIKTPTNPGEHAVPPKGPGEEDAAPGHENSEEPGHSDKPGSGKNGEAVDAAPELPEIHYGEELLPAAVRQMREDILDAAKTANFDRLRLIYDANDSPPTLSFGETEDPIDFLKQSSGDAEGFEILAIMIEVLEAGWVHKNVGQTDEMYVWPYFAEFPLDHLNDQQKVELYKIATASDVEEMKSFGSYIFYRLGIGSDGTWYYFVAGD